ncbi:hypothetical protein CB1_000993005 [Camelus ferus]|nr:hypothetical protein CB1_000993005 [Camelus ferus]
MTQSVVVQGKLLWTDGEPVAAKRPLLPPNVCSLSFLSAVGQCGNQIGCCFWDLALREHAAVNQAVLIDMEEGVVNEILQGPLRDVFDSKQLITDISGSGNNCKIELMMNSGKLGTVIKPKSLVTSSAGTSKKRQEKPFDKMNNIVANLLLNLTSSARFEGSLNMDLNEISMNLVPFPQLHYLVSSLTPLYTLADVNIPPRRLDQMFSDAFSKDHQLIRADPKHSLYLACALMVRGNVQISDLRRNIESPRAVTVSQLWYEQRCASNGPTHTEAAEQWMGLEHLAIMIMNPVELTSHSYKV